MKKTLTLIAVSIFLTSSPALANHDGSTDHSNHETTQAESQHDVVIKVDGMVCDFCAQSIKKVFGKQESIKDVNVNLDAGEITLDYKEGKTLDHETISKLVTDSGYTIRDMKHAKEK